ncbi:MAG TPA: lysophospholipid acyltransferase family protein [Sedimentisphaerales bacterium]|nr:lysophospholipid acyltransferase family protein [Sedimentisphaerales bacterium]
MLRGFISTGWYHVARCLCAVFAILCFGFKVYGRSNIPRKKAFLLFSNHQSYMDPIFCAGLLPIKMCYLARDTLFENWFFGRLIRSVNAIPVKRGQGDIAAMKAVIERLRSGLPVCLFPEGTRTVDGKITAVKPGVALLARRANVPVVPMVIEGAYEAWPRDRKIFSIGHQVVAYYSEPIAAERIKQMGDEAFAEHLTHVLWDLQNQIRVKVGRKPFDYPLAGSGTSCASAGENK